MAHAASSLLNFHSPLFSCYCTSHLVQDGRVPIKKTHSCLPRSCGQFWSVEWGWKPSILDWMRLPGKLLIFLSKQIDSAGKDFFFLLLSLFFLFETETWCPRGIQDTAWPLVKDGRAGMETEPGPSAATGGLAYPPLSFLVTWNKFLIVSTIWILKPVTVYPCDRPLTFTPCAPLASEHLSPCGVPRCGWCGTWSGGLERWCRVVGDISRIRWSWVKHLCCLPRARTLTEYSSSIRRKGIHL